MSWMGPTVSTLIRPPKEDGEGVPSLEQLTEHSLITFGLEAALPEPRTWRLTTSRLMQ